MVVGPLLAARVVFLSQPLGFHGSALPRPILENDGVREIPALHTASPLEFEVPGVIQKVQKKVVDDQSAASSAGHAAGDLLDGALLKRSPGSWFLQKMSSRLGHGILLGCLSRVQQLLFHV